MNETTYTFTIFIPTFNRAHTLGRALDSIQLQTFRDFEVVIVDDGSTDGTEELVKKWTERSQLPVTYVWQPNQGKHAAHNHGAELAKGSLFITLDSDDMLAPGSLEIFKTHWDSIPAAQRQEFAGVEGLCAHMDDGRIDGDRFPEDIFDSNFLEIRKKYGIRGDKKNAIRTELVKENLYPRFEGEKHFRPGLLWERLAHDYKFRYINEVVQLIEVQPDGISSDRLSLRTKNPRSFHYYFLESVNCHFQYDSPKDLYQNHVRLVRYGLHAGIGFKDQCRQVKHKGYWFAALPTGILEWIADRIRIRKRGQS
jgi:glycosyltransferase involved in cell wall biosynthesis